MFQMMPGPAGESCCHTGQLDAMKHHITCRQQHS